MPCLVACLALLFPRLALALVWWRDSNYLTSPYGHWVWPFLGFLFLPLTTLTFAFVYNSWSVAGHVTAFGWLLTALAVLVDIGLVGGGHSHYRRHRARS